jgi:hypothetical protein
VFVFLKTLGTNSISSPVFLGFEKQQVNVVLHDPIIITLTIGKIEKKDTKDKYTRRRF